MEVTLLTTGLVCLLAAIVGGGLKGLGFEFPVLSSLRRQLLLGILGVVLIFFSQRSTIYGYFETPTAQSGRKSTPALSTASGPWPYFQKCDEGTRNVFVASGFTRYSDAAARVDSLRRHASQFRYKLWKTVGGDGQTNEQYAIVVGHGLNKSDARDLVDQVRDAGVAPDSYYTVQKWTTVCTDLSGVED